MPAGRPSDYDYELCKDICNEVAEGNNIVKVLESNEIYPCWSTFRRWKQENIELQTLYVNSIQDKAEHVDYEIDQILQELKDEKLTPSAANVYIQTLKWKAAKYYPKMFGDKVDLTTDNKPINTNTGLEGYTFEQLYQLKYGTKPK